MDFISAGRVCRKFTTGAYETEHLQGILKLNLHHKVEALAVAACFNVTKTLFLSCTLMICIVNVCYT